MGGWLSVIVFLGLMAIWPRGLFLEYEAIFPAVEVAMKPFAGFPDTPFWSVRLMVAILILAVPELLIALVGGGLIRRGGPRLAITAPSIRYEPRPQSVFLPEHGG